MNQGVKFPAPPPDISASSASGLTHRHDRISPGLILTESVQRPMNTEQS